MRPRELHRDGVRDRRVHPDVPAGYGDAPVQRDDPGHDRPLRPDDRSVRAPLAGVLRLHLHHRDNPGRRWAPHRPRQQAVHRGREEERRARFRHCRPLHRPLPGNLQQHRPPHELPRHDDHCRPEPALHRLQPAGQPRLGQAALVGAGRRHLGHPRLADNERGRLARRPHRLPDDHLPRRDPDMAGHGHGHRVSQSPSL